MSTVAVTQASNLPGKLYHDEEVYRRELERIFFRSWLCVGREEDLPEPGSFLTRSVGDESVIIARSNDRTLRAFYNICRHRGSRLISEPEGGRRVLQCPYHSWSYALDGKLAGAPHTENLKNFDREDYSLLSIQLDTWAGFIFVKFTSGPPSLQRYLGDLIQKFERVPLAALRRGGRNVYEVAANWKVLCENFSECYHCPTIHPELSRITFYRSAENDAFLSGRDRHGSYSGGRMELAEGCDSMTLTGRTNRPPLRGLTEEERRHIHYYLIFPNLFFSLHPDYLMVHTVWPNGPRQATVSNEFFFEPEAMARGDFDPGDAVGIWDIINRQDWQACERVQLGMMSRASLPGRYSEMESLVYDFDRYVLKLLGRKGKN